jgi:hypothetical protein
MNDSLFPPHDFARLDDSPDPHFYLEPRKVVHLDAAACAAVSDFLRNAVPPDAEVLDLLSSWRSHWPPELTKRRLVGLGLNAEEMAENPDLDDFVVHDLNAVPKLPFEAASFDAAVITVSIQYLTQPVALFRDVHRVLRNGGLFAILYSNRIFPTKAVAIWRRLSDRQHADLIASYFQEAGGFAGIEYLNCSPPFPPNSDPLYVVMSRKEGTQ